MATQKTKTWDDYYREEKAKNDAAVRAERDQRQKRDEESIRSFDGAVDRQTDEAVRGYRQDMAEDAAKRRDQLDTNALEEALTRRQIRDRMADLGLSHSGLAEAQGNAAGAARSSADRTVAEGRQAAQQRLQSAIDRVVSEAAEKKAKNSLSVRQNTEKWAADRASKAQTQAKTYADKAYAAEQRRLADVQKALLQQINIFKPDENENADASLTLLSDPELEGFAPALAANNMQQMMDASAGAFSSAKMSKTDHLKYIPVEINGEKPEGFTTYWQREYLKKKEAMLEQQQRMMEMQSLAMQELKGEEM